jgi:hypothetical protein
LTKKECQKIKTEREKKHTEKEKKGKKIKGRRKENLLVHFKNKNENCTKRSIEAISSLETFGKKNE